MYNAKYIWPGILIFLGLFTIPFWANFGASKYERPAIALPQGKAANATEWAQTDQLVRISQPGTACVEVGAYMRAEHMQILNEWRDKALREGKREYVASNGSVWNISLQNTCMKCHGNKADFCDKCHDSNSVKPYCWDCHVAPKGNRS